MKISAQRLKQIIKEELKNISEEEMRPETLAPAVADILENSNLDAKQLAVINQYISLLQGTK